MTHFKGNRLIDSLASSEKLRVLAHAKIVEISAAQVIHTPGSPFESVIFPIDCVLSIMATLQDGETCEIGMIGNEGASGVEIAFGAPILRETICQVSGIALEIPSALFLSAIEENAGFDSAIRASEKARSFFNEQMTICNAFHRVDQRCARWLLLMADAAKREVYPTTHEFISHMVGTRRATVTAVLRRLHESGAINYRRGRLRIIDRPSLEAKSCECYKIVSQMFTAALHSWPNESRAFRRQITRNV